MAPAIPIILSAIQTLQQKNQKDQNQMSALGQNRVPIQIPQNQIPTITSVYSNLWR